MDKKETEFVVGLKKYFIGQRKRIVAELNKKSKGLADEIFDLNKEVKISVDLFLPMILDFAKQSGQDALRLTGNDKPYKLGPIIRSSLEKRAKMFSTEINKTTFDKLKRTVAESLDAGESRQALEERITEVYDGFTVGRAGTIARTEVLVASQEGTFSGYQQGNIDLKIWVSTPDEKTRDSHAEVDGEEQPLNQPFSNGLMFPGDPEGDASEVVNCRCTI